jgi:predicted AAA+ superfamily ATPase
MKRNIESILRGFWRGTSLESKVLLIEGARQVGKTYLVESVLKDMDQTRIISINLEKERDLKFEMDGTHDFKEFTQWLIFKKGFKDNQMYTVFIDEAQESKNLGSYVLSMKEEWKNTRVILTGSSMNKLFDGSVRVPVGRIEYLTVWPFSFLEFLKFGDFTNQVDFIKNYNIGDEIYDSVHSELLNKYDEYLFVGGMPDVVKSFYRKEDFVQKLRFIIASQQDDFYRKESTIKNNLFIDAIKAVSGNVGYPFKKTHISRNDYGASAVLSLLKQWYIILEVAQRGAISAGGSFHPKEYLYDLGILRIFRETTIPKISAINTLNEKLRIPLGGLIENAILLNMLEGKGGFYEISGWKNKSGKEVDFIYKDMERTLPIEVKASTKITNRHAKNLIHYLSEHKLKTGVLVSMDKLQKIKIQGFNIVNIPAYLFSRDIINKLSSS